MCGIWRNIRRIYAAYAAYRPMRHIFFRIFPAFATLPFRSPAWSGLCSAANRARLNAVLRRCRRLGYLNDNDAASVGDLFHSADDKLFRNILHNSAHVLQPLIPDRQPSSYDLRPRSHDKLLLNKTTYLNERDCHSHALQRQLLMCTSLQTRPMLDLLYLVTDYIFQKLRWSAFSKE